MPPAPPQRLGVLSLIASCENKIKTLSFCLLDIFFPLERRGEGGGRKGRERERQRQTETEAETEKLITCLRIKLLNHFLEKEVRGCWQQLAFCGERRWWDELPSHSRCPGGRHRRVCNAALGRCLALIPTGQGNCQLCFAWLPWTTSWEPAAFYTWL